ncbi:MAG TPA: hypothetical protein VK983_01200 [Candidatus Limnocylindrales bacterium]|nr:hypothetical protein [Candidatus Limnocylindrales bacterium]
MRLRLLLLKTRHRTRLMTALVLAVIMFSAALPVMIFGSAEAELLGFRRLQLSDSSISSTNVEYNFSFNTITAGPIGSIRFEFCSNYQYNTGDPCTPPPGFDAQTAALSAQSGITNFVLDTDVSTPNKIVIGRTVADSESPQPLGYVFSNIINPSAVASYYVRISVHSSFDGSGPEMDSGVVVFATNIGIEITTEVPPYLLFCTGITIEGFNCGTAEGNFVNFGELSSRTSRTGTSQMLASTNAAFGYSITLAGETMTAGNNTIPAMNGEASRPGTSQFGINARINSAPNVGADPEGNGLTNPAAGYDTPNSFRFRNGEIIASSNNTDDYRKLTVSYLVNASAGQPPGRYVSTISYICLANF